MSKLKVQYIIYRMVHLLVQIEFVIQQNSFEYTWYNVSERNVNKIYAKILN